MSARRTLALLLLAALATSVAQAAPTLSLLGGTSLPTGRDDRELNLGPAVALRVAPFGTKAVEPFVRASWARQFPSGAVFGTTVATTLPVIVQQPARVEHTALEAGLARRVFLGPVQCSLEGAAGVDWVHPTTLPRLFRNDRRPDPAVPPDVRVGGAGVTMSLAAGVRVPLVSRVALDASAAVQGATVNGVTHPPVALLAGASWPVGREAVPHDASNAWRLRVTSGPAWRLHPDDDDAKARVGACMHASLAHPYDAHLTFELDGAWAQVDAVDPSIVRFERDEFGNLVPVYGEDRPAWTLVAVTPAVRLSTGNGPWRASLRGGVGVGHTGGDGATTGVTYIDMTTLEAVTVQTRYGFGRPAAGAAWLAGATLERKLTDGIALLLEADTWGVSTKYAGVQLADVRAGVELR